MQNLAAHTARNLNSIVEVLRYELRDKQQILEIGSGNGQHATEICRVLTHLVWQTSDVAHNHLAIQDWLVAAAVESVKSPLRLDVRTDSVSSKTYDAVFSANTAHIMSIAEVEQMFQIASAALREHGIFCLYGPFRMAGRFNATSNARFHASLQANDPEMGVRNLEELDAFGTQLYLRRLALYAMPSNNMLVIWRRAEGLD